jgi:DNA invertase Pin-like site-specific DNA recombinase
MRIGYCRISTVDQDPQLQIDALERAQCDKIFTDRASGASRDRPQLAAALAFAREGDTVIVWKFDRFARSTLHMIELADELHRRGIQFQSLTESFDTSTAWGQCIYQVLAACGQLERSLIRERTMAGLAAARARGRVGGRPRALTPEQEATVLGLLAAGTLSHGQIGKLFQCHTRTIRRVRERHRTTRSPSHPDGGNGNSAPT